jgi:hypothetical protein
MNNIPALHADSVPAPTPSSDAVPPAPPLQGIFPQAFADTENGFIKARRAFFNVNSGWESPLITGLATSGGGVRSAIFCLGFMQALAKAELLKRFDFLSTVSGGGYIGGFLGAWIHNAKDARKVEAALSDSESPPLKFLRNNGRYLAPNGAGDVVAAAAAHMRSWFTVWLIMALLFLGLLFIAEALKVAFWHVDWEDSFNVVRPPEGSSLFEKLITYVRVSPYFTLAWWSLLTVTVPPAIAYWFGDRFRRMLPLWIVLVVVGVTLWYRHPALALAVSGRWLVIWIIYAVTASFAIYAFIKTHSREVAASQSNAIPSGGSNLTRDRFRRLLGFWIVLLGVGAALWYFRAPFTLLTLGSVWRLIWIAYAITASFAIYALAKAHAPEVARNRLNDILGGALTLTLAIVIFAIVDTFGQTLMAVTVASAWSAIMLPILAAVAQWVMPQLMEATNKKKLPPWLSSLVIPISALLIALLASGILSLTAHSLSYQVALAVRAETTRYGFAVLAISVAILTTVIGIRLGRRWTMLLPLIILGGTAIALAWSLARKEDVVQQEALYVCATGAMTLATAALVGFSFRFVNLSSHHRLYSARLTRTFLGASNPNRINAGHAGNGPSAKQGGDVTTAVPGDRIDYLNYRPYQYGGPLHLINTTVNETVDGISQIEQRDRRGYSLAIGPGGLSARTTDHALFEPTPENMKPEDGRARVSGGVAQKFHTLAIKDRPYIDVEMPTLGSWIGISGAAFTTGLGARTNLAISFLLGFFNIRLGYWWNSGVRPSDRSERADRGAAALGDLWSKAFPAQAGLMEEFLARFHGASREHWYLSDGGHFENTGVYELIRRRVPLIVCCDCGADPKYQFADAANLVRKARIDFGAEIRFWTNAEIAAGLPNLVNHIGEPSDLKPMKVAPNKGCSAKHAAIAWVKYPGGKDRSLLLVVKPTISSTAPVDVRQYDSADRAFPQQTTLDQFFDEAQWESYRKAGNLIGEALFTDDPQLAPGRWGVLAALATAHHSSPSKLQGII